MENFNKSVSPKEKKSLKFMVVPMTRNENGGKAQTLAHIFLSLKNLY